MNPNLLDALGARRGIVCAIGAGGKKTTLYRLLRAHPGRVGCTATVFTPPYPADLPAQVLVAPPDEMAARVATAAATQGKLAFACPTDKADRLAGLPLDQVAACHAAGRFDLTLVKADGARMRLLKAPGPGEPMVPPGTTTVLALVSARVLGLPLSARHVHRPERVAAISGAAPDTLLEPRHVARVIASAEGLLHGVGQAAVIPVINMAEGPERRALALETARLALQMSARYDRVVVAAMTAPEPILEVVTRSTGAC